MSISITLSHTVTATDEGTIKLNLNTTAVDISGKVFAIEVYPRSADLLAPLYRFSHICSPAELVEFPDEEAEDNCYFRTDSIEMIFDSSKIVERVLKHVSTDISFLVAEYKKLEASGVTDTIVFG